MIDRLKNVLISLDQFAFSVFTLGKAKPDETISAAAWRFEQEGRWQGKLFRPCIDTLFFFDKEHCKSSFESEVEGTQLNQVYRDKRKGKE